MNPEEALKILDQTAAEAPINRALHIRAQQAVAVLQVAITPKVEEKEKKEEKKN